MSETSMFKCASVMAPGIYRAPIPVIRVWCYLVERYSDGYSGTPGMLYSEMREAGLKVARRSMSEAIWQLESAGMASVQRHGHYMQIALQE